MTRETFKKYFKINEKILKRGHALYKLQVDLLDYDNDYYTLIAMLGKELFGEQGWDHVQNYEESNKEVYSKENPMCWDAKTKAPEYWDVDSLYDYLVRQKYISKK